MTNRDAFLQSGALASMLVGTTDYDAMASLGLGCLAL